MRVLMLGWEFPPLITGGLGTACAGLTRALVTQGAQVDFVLPRPVDSVEVDGVRVLSPGCADLKPKSAQTLPETCPTIDQSRATPCVLKDQVEGMDVSELNRTPFLDPVPGLPPLSATKERHLEDAVSTRFGNHPYPRDTTPEPVATFLKAASGNPIRAARALEDFVLGGGTVPEEQKHMLRQMAREAWAAASEPTTQASCQVSTTDITPMQSAPPVSHADYGENLREQVERFTQFCVESLATRHFDVIHAHDWMTYEAGLALRALTGKPLVVHVHSTEFDRSGEHGNPEVLAIESRGIREADQVICVSALTRNLVVSRYAAPAERCRVIYNGVELSDDSPGPSEIRRDDRIVLYFGRITYQKGPEFFMAAAKKVLEHTSNVKFVVAGSGDQAERMIRMAAELGIGDRVLFTGFLRGRDISRVFSLADLYVMPSRSEPFGIAPLEAMSHGVPVLISKTSGVSEVLTHALKVDFWDIEDMASKIVAVLKYPPLSQHLKDHGRFEVRRITWDGAAQKCIQVYNKVSDSNRHLQP
ncbi:MAG: hypothetical protein CMJ30_06190 [Phycisphaerae bacterium]|nr:hypothetical protein [Phycisphaerae bacterium]